VRAYRAKRQAEGYYRQWQASPAGAANRARRRSQRQAFINGLKLASGCVDCGYAEHAVALDFHHTADDKTYSVSRMTLFSEERIMQEVAKCEVVCANCHRIRHHAVFA
jgi:hypothetical protein